MSHDVAPGRSFVADRKVLSRRDDGTPVYKGTALQDGRMVGTVYVCGGKVYSTEDDAIANRDPGRETWVDVSDDKGTVIKQR